MITMTIERSKELREKSVSTMDAAPIPWVADLERNLATHQLYEVTGSLRPGESLPTDRFLDESISVGKEYQVRAIGQERYAQFKDV